MTLKIGAISGRANLVGDSGLRDAQILWVIPDSEMRKARDLHEPAREPAKRQQGLPGSLANASVV